MIAPWRALALAAALNVTVAVGVATAQTVIVTNAPRGSTVELALNAETIGSSAADSVGTARLAVNLSEHRGKAETDARIYVDVCDDLRRVSLVEPALQPPPLAPACARRELVGLFVVRQVTTLVVDVGGSVPTVRVRQGPAPAAWLRPPESEPLPSERIWRPAPTGLVLSGGGGFANFRDASALACGNVANCSGKDSPLTYTLGAAYWLTRFVAAEASYVKPADATAEGSGDTYRFNSSLDTHVLIIAGKVGVPIGPVRLYGLAGATYHRATSSTTETIDDRTVTIDNVAQTIKGGTQTFELKTAGWGWLLGGGGEVWVATSFAIYAEVGRASLKGQALDGGEGQLDERLTFLLVGGRFRIGH